MSVAARWIDGLPPGLLAVPATELHAALGGPTVIELPGRREPALFVSVLMHGNETTGWDAIRHLLRRYRPGGDGPMLPRSLLLFIGNTEAAATGVRYLPSQPDYNRVWPGGKAGDSDEAAMMRDLVDRLQDRGLFAAVDVHNNTGVNPHYACVNVLDHRALHLAAMFGRTVVYFIRPTGVCAMALSRLCPAVTLECGKIGNRYGKAHAAEYLDACLHLAEHPRQPVTAHDLDLFHTVATVKLPANLAFGFAADGLDLRFVDDLDQLNFRELPPGTRIADVRPDLLFPLLVRDEADHDVSAHYFEVRDGELRTRCALMPSMLTKNEDVIRQDCLCYVMERYNDHLEQKTAGE